MVFRSIEDQKSLWDARVKKQLEEGLSQEEAEAVVGQKVAIPGTSEHHTGLAIDISCDQADIAKTEALYQWYAEHCWEYGFILRYPADKIEITGITYEPWHFRYVGVEMAKAVTESGLCLEEYLQMLKAS